MRTLHLFAGAGGGLLADIILGHEPVAAVEWDAFCCQVLRERAAEGWFPGLQVFEGDVRLFYPSEYAGRVDCIHAGFPCQDISVAGKQMGVDEGTRSGLYREILRVADVVRPRFLFLENVSAILNNGLGTVLGDLAARGYDGRWCCLRASDVGANHQRDRWWMLAHTDFRGRGPEYGEQQNERPEVVVGGGKEWFSSMAHAQGREIDKRKRGDLAEETGGREGLYATAGSGREDVAHAKGNSERPGFRPGESGPERRGRSGHIRSENDVADAAERGQPMRGRPQGEGRHLVWGNLQTKGWLGEFWWATEPDLGRVAHGVASRVDRLKALGNGQVPLQAAVAFKILMEAFNADRI